MSRGPQDGCAVERGHVVSWVSGPESGSGAVVVRHVPPHGRRGGAPCEGGGPRPGGAHRRGGDQGALGLSGACGRPSPGRWDCGEGPGWRVLCGRVITDVASAPPAPPRVAAVQRPSVCVRDPPPRTHLLAPAARSFLRRRAASSCAPCALLILAVRRLSPSGRLEFGVTPVVRGGRGMTSRTRS